MAREGSFHATAFGAKVKLPDPKVLTCFLMEKRPSVVLRTSQSYQRLVSRLLGEVHFVRRLQVAPSKAARSENPLGNVPVSR